MRYLAAFGPASATDVQAWSALAGIREVLEELRPQLVTFRDDRKRELFDLPEAPRPSEDTPAPARFLPGFDNLILSHADRTRIMADEHRPLVTTKNLLVLPTFLVDGFVAGTWKSSLAKKEARLTVLPFEPLSKAAKAELALEAREAGAVHRARCRQVDGSASRRPETTSAVRRYSPRIQVASRLCARLRDTGQQCSGEGCD